MPLFENGRFASQSTSHHFIPQHEPWSHPRLDSPHVHHALTHGTEVITCDLGSNKLWGLKQGEKDWDVIGTIEGFEDGDGPRHAVVHPDGKSESLSRSLTL